MMSGMDFEPTDAQHATIAVLVGLIGISGCVRRPPQDGDVILDLLPASHTLNEQPFCVRITPDGAMRQITDEEAGLTERPTPMEALRLRRAAMVREVDDELRDE